MPKKNLYNILALAMVMLATIIPAAGLAANDSIIIQPAKNTISLKPGEKMMNSVMVANGTATTVILKVSVKDYNVTDENGHIAFTIKSNLQSALNWLIPQYTIITVPPFDSQKMDYIVTIPKDMAGGGYQGAIVFQVYDKNKDTQTGNIFGTLVNLNVLGEGITTGGTISNFRLPLLQYKDPTKFGFTVKNPSNSNLSLSGKITFTNIVGKQVGEFDAGQLDITPQSSRRFDFQWTDSPLLGIYKGEVALQDALRNDHLIRSSIWFIFIPWQKVMFPLLLILLAIAIMVAYAYYPRYKHSFTIDKIKSTVKKIKIPILRKN